MASFGGLIRNSDPSHSSKVATVPSDSRCCLRMHIIARFRQSDRNMIFQSVLITRTTDETQSLAPTCNPSGETDNLGDVTRPTSKARNASICISSQPTEHQALIPSHSTNILVLQVGVTAPLYRIHWWLVYYTYLIPRFVDGANDYLNIICAQILRIRSGSSFK
jgi:hypothetical protein